MVASHNKSITKHELILGSLSIFLFAICGYFSPGFDDEVFNMRLIEDNNFDSIIPFIKKNDIHPPGSYVVNYVMFFMFNNWNVVRLTNGFFCSLTLLLVWQKLCDRQECHINKLFFYICLCLNPGLLLWGTSLRWYSLYIPLLAITTLILSNKKSEGYKYWSVIFGLCTILWYINYVTILVAPIIILTGLITRWDNINKELPYIIIAGILSITICSFQFEHFQQSIQINKNQDPYSIIKSVLGFGIHFLNGHGSYPFSIWGVFMIIGNIMLMLKLRHEKFNPTFNAVQFLIFILIGLAMTTLGLGAKFRNLIIITPAFSYFQYHLFRNYKIGFTKLLIFFCICTATIFGLMNVILHKNSTKMNWNLPVNQIIELAIRMKEKSESEILITTDPLLAYHLNKEFADIYIVGQDTGWESKMDKYNSIIIDTWKGSMDDSVYTNFRSKLNALKKKEIQVLNIKKDTYFPYKKLIEPNLPEYYSTIYVNVHSNAQP